MNPQHRYPASESAERGGSEHPPRTYVCGNWEIDCVSREVRTHGAAVPLGARAFEIVAMLVQSGGALVTKDDLFARVWSRTIVEDNTLHFHISAIRKALGADRGMLRTVSGRGYRLLGPWTIGEENSAGEPRAAVPAQRSANPFLTNIPVAAAALIGREAAVKDLQDLLSAHRVVTLAGPGGIGKTVLAAEVARRLFPAIEGDVFLVELVSLSDQDLVPSAVARTLGLRLSGDETSPESIARVVGNRKILLVLDNCEHVVDGAARMVETTLRLCPRTTILATSREVLRIDGEYVYHVAPLEVPSPHQDDMPEVLQHGAVQLFIARTKPLRADFSAGTENLPAIATICRRLDGIPLAIEFAAARAATLSVRQVARRLNDRFVLLTGGRRTALPRHQTLRAALDWSYELLPVSEQCLLRCLAVFRAGFTLEAAAAVIGGCETSVVLGISNLVSKSLVTLGGSESARRWYLLETIRAYALEKLEASPEREPIARRHAEYYRDLFARADTEALVRRRGEWLADYASEIDNVRSALEWAFSPGGGDVSVGIALTVAAVPLWVNLSLTEESRRRVERALAALPAATVDRRLEMKLQAARATPMGQAGPGEDMEFAWTRTLDLAERLGEVEYQLRALWGLWGIRDRESLALAQRFASVASTPADRLIGDKMIGHSCHIQGNQDSARRRLERVVANHNASAESESAIIRFHIDQQPMAFLARVLWLQGLSEQAVAMAARSVEHAKVDDHANSVCFALAYVACPIALWTGKLDLAEQYIGVLHETSTRYALTLWDALCRAQAGVLLIKRGDLLAGLPQLLTALEACHVMPSGYRVLFFIADVAEALGRAGQTLEGLATIDEAMDRAERTAEGWILPELLRVKGELLRLDGSRGTVDSAEGCFRQALQLARAQGALSWELRAAASLAFLYRTQGRHANALSVLEPIYSRFTEGFGTTDLIAAKQLLDELRHAARRQN